MAYCWDQFGEGKLNLFNDPLISKNYCALCYHVTFKEGNVEIPWNEFLDYLKTKRIDRSNTYASYLGVGDLDSMTPSLDDKIIKTSDDYGVFFIYKKANNAWWVVPAGVTAIVGGGLIAFFSGGTLAVAGGTAAIVGVSVVFADQGMGMEMGGVSWNPALMLTPYNNEMITNLNCESLPVRGGKG